MSDTFGIHWFRRDLRIVGNPALQWSWREHKGRVLGVFCFDKKFLARPDFSVNRFQFFLETLKDLKKQMRQAGGDLLCLDVGPRDAFPKLFEVLGEKRKPSTFSWNRDYEPFAIDRDAGITKWLISQGVKAHTERDHILIEPHEIQKPGDPNGAYQVFTPFSRRWLEMFETPDVQSRVAFQRQAEKTPLKFHASWENLLPDCLEVYAEANAKKVTVRIPPAGREAALKQLEAFRSRLGAYGETRDFPSIAGTSGFSIYLKNGSLTTAQIVAQLGLKSYSKKEKDSAAKFFSELIWREFYYYILAKFPYVEKQSFLEKFRNLAWENRKDFFEAWKTGMTGYPIVDAGMRQLKTTGWMHNRVRMIVASFLTKDLLIDWQWGERYFMEQLLDGDLAPNNGGWQWAASTGCDPQPYFRIFNPYLQSKKFDPEGKYLKKYLPELNHLSAQDIHEPPPLLRGSYPAPIVDHAERREKALQLYKVN